ncbi:MAG: vitamin K epoxide reductase [Parcubacteria group bacterium Greene0416_79]|nr:MAG: vitamin K epoxide reductase [Parcubacteria group bacterium Greene0416_79]
MPEMTLYFALHILLIACAFGGLALAAFIHFRKRLHTPIVCPVGHSCDPVVRSDYSRFMDIPVEILGVIYYTVTAIAYAALLAMPELQTGMLGAALLGLSAAALLFSLYLTAVQGFILREWCTWCLISAALCAVIFFVGLRLADIGALGFIALFTETGR